MVLFEQRPPLRGGYMNLKLLPSSPVLGDCKDGGGIVLNKDKARPRWRDCVTYADRAERG